MCSAMCPARAHTTHACSVHARTCSADTSTARGLVVCAVLALSSAAGRLGLGGASCGRWVLDSTLHAAQQRGEKGLGPLACHWTPFPLVS